MTSAHTVSTTYLDSIGARHLESMLIWVADAGRTTIDISDYVASLFGASRQDMIGKRIDEFVSPNSAVNWEESFAEHERVAQSGAPARSIRWLETRSGWRKFIISRARIPSGEIVTIAHDLTQVDPLSDWLLRLDIVKRRLNLGPDYQNRHMQLAELLVLHRLVRGRTYQQIANEFSVSISTIRYRMEKLKELFTVDSVSELWSEIYASGLVHLLSISLGMDTLPDSEADIFKLDPSSE